MSSPPFVDAVSTPAQQVQHYQPRQQQFATPIRFPHAVDTSGSNKSVRFQSQPLPPTQQQMTPYSQSQYTQPPSLAQTQQSKQLAPAITSTTHQRATSTSQFKASVPKPTGAITRKDPVSGTSLTRRLHWNATALTVVWATPLLTTRPKDIYWSGLDLVYEHFGGNMDERIDAVVGWITWAATIVLLFNTLEALVLLHRTSGAPQPPATSGAVSAVQSPMTARSLNFVTASRLKGSPKTRISSIGPGSPIAASPSPRSATSTLAAKDAVDYSRFSPSLRQSFGAERGTRSVSASGANSRFSPSSSPMPTSVSMNALGMGVSPLSAFRARHASSSSPFRSSSSSQFAQSADVSLSYEQDDPSLDASNFLGDESFEVERALHSLRTSMPPPSPSHVVQPSTPDTAIRA